MLRLLVRIADTGELGDEPLAGLRIEPFPVARLAHLQWRADVDLDHRSVGLDHLAHIPAGVRVRCDRCADGDPAVLGDLARDESDTADVEIAVRLREPQLARQMVAHDVAVEQGDRTPAFLDELAVHDLGERRLAGAGQPGEEQREAQLARRRIDRAQGVDHFRIREPVRHFLPVRDSGRDFRIVEVHRVLLGHAAAADRNVPARRRRVAQAAGGEDCDSEIALVLPRELLGGVTRVEGVGVGRARVRGTGMIALHDEVGASVVAADDRVPQRFARAGSAHRERQQRKGRELSRIVPQDLLVALDAREMVQVPVHADSDHGMQQEVASSLPGGGEGHLPLALVHRAAGVERDDPSPAEPVEEPGQLRGRMAQVLVVVVRRKLNAADAASHVDVADSLVKVSHTGVVPGSRAVDPFGFDALVRLPRRGDIEHREDESLLVAQRDARAGLDPLREFPTHVERHRYGPQLAAGKPHRFDDVLVRLAIHESVEGREPAVHHQLDVAELSLREGDGRHVERQTLQLLPFDLVDEERLQRYPGRGRFEGHAFPRGYWAPEARLLDSRAARNPAA